MTIDDVRVSEYVAVNIETQNYESILGNQNWSPWSLLPEFVVNLLLAELTRK